MVDDKAYDTASDIAAEEGIVIVEGPDGVAVSLTPRAAEETSSRLHAGAREAAAQRRRLDPDAASAALLREDARDRG